MARRREGGLGSCHVRKSGPGGPLFVVVVDIPHQCRVYNYDVYSTCRV